MCARSWKRLGNMYGRPIIPGAFSQSKIELRVFSVSSNCTGNLVLLWTTETRSRTQSEFTRSATLNRPRSQPRNLLSMATLKRVRSLKLPASSSLARIAQTCLGRRGRFWPIIRPLFQALRFRVSAGSYTRGIIGPPILPPYPSINPLLTHGV